MLTSAPQMGGGAEVMNLPERVVMATASSKAIPSCRSREPGASYTGLLGHVETTMLRKA